MKKKKKGFRAFFDKFASTVTKATGRPASFFYRFGGDSSLGNNRPGLWLFRHMAALSSAMGRGWCNIPGLPLLSLMDIMRFFNSMSR